MVPYADWNLLKFPDKEQALEKILDLTMLSDIFPTGYHGCVTAGVTPDRRLHRRRRPGRPRGRARRAAARRGGGDRRRHERRPPQAGQELRLRDRRPAVRTHRLPTRSSRSSASRMVDCAVDCRRLRGQGPRPRRRGGAGHRAQLDHGGHPRGRRARHPGLYVTGDPGAADDAAKEGSLVDPHRPRLGEVALVHHRPVPGDALPPPADERDPERPRPDREGGQRHRDLARRRADQGYQDFDGGVAKKFVLDPHGMLGGKQRIGA